MKSRFSFLPCSLFVLILSMVVCADQPKGHGGGRGGMGGPLPEKQRAIIHELAENHKKLTRKVEMTKKGYVATSTSGDKGLVAKLKTHFRYMKKRLDSGAMVRRWDPAYAEMTEFYDQLKVEKCQWCAQWRDVRRGPYCRVQTGSPAVEQICRVQSWISGRGEHTVVIGEGWRLGD